MRRPIDQYTISLAFGKPESGSHFGVHIGVDYAGQEGRPVFSPVNGTITQSVLTPDVGNLYEIKEDGNGRLHRLMHLKTKPLSVGTHVTEGQQIGTSGGAVGQAYSGTLSTGPHLHWDVRKPNTKWTDSLSNYFDPEQLVKENNMLDDEGAKEVYRSTLHREPENDQVWRPYVGRPFSEVSKEFRNSQEWKNQDTAIKEYPGLVSGQGSFVEVLTAGQKMYVKKGQ